MNAHLAPCMNCLRHLNYRNYNNLIMSEKYAAVNDFDLDLFLENYKPIFRGLPLYTPDNFPEGNYTKDWARISEETRSHANWICSCCGVNLNTDRGLLHVHHVDGNRGNDAHYNLRVLCALCHQKQPLHGRMYLRASEKLKIKNLRRQQGLSSECAARTN